MLSSDRTIETKYFLLSNLKYKTKYDGFVRVQKYAFSNYYGEEIKNPIYETSIKPLVRISKKTIKPIKLFGQENKNTNKSVAIRENISLVLSSKNSRGLQTKHLKNTKSVKKINLNVIKMKFPYCKPFVKNSFTELVLYNKNKDFIIAKNIEKKKAKM